MLDPINPSKSNNSEMPILQPMGFTDILDAMFSLYRRHFGLFLAIAAVWYSLCSSFQSGVSVARFYTSTSVF